MYEQDIPETKLGGKWTGAGDADIMSLLQLMVRTSRERNLRDTLADKLIGAARVMGISDEDIEDELFTDKPYGSPVFYVP